MISERKGDWSVAEIKNKGGGGDVIKICKGIKPFEAGRVGQIICARKYNTVGASDWLKIRAYEKDNIITLPIAGIAVKMNVVLALIMGSTNWLCPWGCINVRCSQSCRWIHCLLWRLTRWFWFKLHFCVLDWILRVSLFSYSSSHRSWARLSGTLSLAFPCASLLGLLHWFSLLQVFFKPE